MQATTGVETATLMLMSVPATRARTRAIVLRVAPQQSNVSSTAYRCECAEGFANGICGYDFISQICDECSVSESTTRRTAPEWQL